ncbi:hypothetical protein GQ43DRAFT_171901 [Delitschia confertaspora ATCC 74209]|uniref:Uncharacterized protein n=1 Tax=Delitschia confertaspora ATCC 74209 TaxID=1513339 RepID=A0A9P4JEZ9_9PLEO|nr:hypothetical protein GQ43DRAFT_171901 [Delitschia confertaspora ATCC 74209]
MYPIFKSSRSHWIIPCIFRNNSQNTLFLPLDHLSPVSSFTLHIIITTLTLAILKALVFENCKTSILGSSECELSCTCRDRTSDDLPIYFKA